MNRFLTIALVLVVFCASAQRKSRKTEPQNQNTPTKPLVLKPVVRAISSKYIIKDSTAVRIFLECDIEYLKPENVLQQVKEHFRISWLVQPDYGVRERLAYGKLELNEQNCFLRDEKLILTFEVPKVRTYPTGLLLTEIFELESAKKATNDLTINFYGNHLSDRYALFLTDLNTPTFRNYINQQETFQIRSINAVPSDVFLVRYQHEFEPAQSPMATTLRPLPRSMKIEQVVKARTNEPIKLEKEGLYMAVEDTATMRNGFGFVLVDNRFPKLTRPEKLVKPVHYMSSNKEIQALAENPNFKQALDRYFLSLTSGNQVLAKRIIKSYYTRVEDANRLFTSYKEGWKTDKGMVYIILGPPNKVQRSRDREIWLYSQNQNFSEIIFTFNRKPNQFTENNYELVRYPEYQAYWYPFVEAWRTGNVLE